MVDQFKFVGNDEAIEMAIRSGNLLYDQNDQLHDWALTLIISNLFELVAEVEEPNARFENGFKLIMGDVFERQLPFDWHPRWVAEAIRNMLDHGMDLYRKQTKNYHDEDKVAVDGIGFIPHDDETQPQEFLFDIHELAEKRYLLLVSPVLYWRYVQEWYAVWTAK